MKRIIGFAATLFAVAFVLLASTSARAQDASPATMAQEKPPGAEGVKNPILKSPLVGSWEGQWVGNRSGGLSVVFATETSGTLMATGTDSFGSDPKPLTNVKVTGQVVKFKAGQFDVTTELSPDGTSLKGRGWYGGYNYDVLLKKQ